MKGNERDVVDFSALSGKDRYKLMVASIVPRPIALVTTVDLKGRINAAPFSFFNAICDDPPLIAIGINMVHEGIIKDTASNIQFTGNFTVNLVDEAIARQMNECAVELPSGESELEYTGLTPVQSLKIDAPSIVEAPISMECRRHSAIQVGRGRTIILGEILAMHFRKGLHDAERNYVNADEAKLISRMHGAGWYLRSTDLFYVKRAGLRNARA